VAFAKRARYDVAFEDAGSWLFDIAIRLAHRHWRREERELRAYARTSVDAAAPAQDEQVTARADSGPTPAAPGRASCSARQVRDRRVGRTECPHKGVQPHDDGGSNMEGHAPRKHQRDPLVRHH
jgi:DNA-directed RNA polymerase specialized sigma24 family protein